MEILMRFKRSCLLMAYTFSVPVFPFQYERKYQISNGPFSSVFCIKQRGKRYHTLYAAKYLRANTERAKREVWSRAMKFEQWFNQTLQWPG